MFDPIKVRNVSHNVSYKPLQHLIITEKNIRTIGRLNYDSRGYATSEELNKSFAGNVALIQKHFAHVCKRNIEINIDRCTFYVYETCVRSNGESLTHNEIRNIMSFVEKRTKEFVNL